MRALFASETRCISNLLQMQWKKQFHSAPEIVSEYITEPSGSSGKPLFNCDFTLEFVERPIPPLAHLVALASVLPRALGAELFLVVEKHTLSPLMLELIGGPAFPIEHYAPYVHVVEATIGRILGNHQQRRREWPFGNVVDAIPIRKAAFARVLVVGKDVTFLYFPHDTRPVMCGQRINLASSDSQHIDCYLDEGRVVCFDGWVRTNVVRGEHTLVALPVVHE